MSWTSVTTMSANGPVMQIDPPTSNRLDAEPSADASASPSLLPDRPIPWFIRARIAFVRGFLMTYARCFGLSGLYKLGQAFATLEYLSDYKRRRRVDRKLVQYFHDDFTPAQRRRITWRYFMRVRCDKMFYTIMDRIPRAKLMNRIKPKGQEYVDAALSDGKGVYIALCHFGAAHVAGLMGALLGYDIAGVRDGRESHVRRYIQKKYRDTFPEVAKMNIVLASSFPRMLYRHLKKNGVVASLLDVERQRGDNTKTVPVTLFGETRNILAGPVQIALRNGAPTIQGFVVSRRNFYYQLIVTPPLLTPEQAQGDEDAAIANTLQRYAAGVEAFARRHPDHLMNI
ncbi:MAG TPA: lysophospholipid acyltransferase family protein [Phycisphaerae bacterium]|nr:lysophospholipid acyltransferase family protein [Phycisphaerae bacterium]